MSSMFTLLKMGKDTNLFITYERAITFPGSHKVLVLFISPFTSESELFFEIMQHRQLLFTQHVFMTTLLHILQLSQ